MKDGRMIDCNAEYWYSIRVSYGRVLKFSAMLDETGIENFVPMMRKRIERNGKHTTVTVPAVSNLCFVHTSKARLDEFLMSMGENRPAHYIWNKATRKPIVVSEKAMRDFMQISRVMSDDILYLKEITSKIREGQRVRVLCGPFQGVEGVVLRVKRSRRVVVELSDMLAIATTYVQPDHLELIAE